MAGPRLGARLWVRLMLLAGAVAAYAVGRRAYEWTAHQATFAGFDAVARKEIAALPVEHSETTAIEQQWVSGGFAGATLRAPVGPRPCLAAVDGLPQSQRTAAHDAFVALDEPDVDVRLSKLATIADRDPANHLVGLILSRELATYSSFKRAEAAAARALGATPDAQRILEAAKDPSTSLRLGDQSLATVIHLFHTLGVARLSPAATEKPWETLKVVIASVLPLSRRTVLGAGSTGESADAKLAIPAPGCDRSSGIALSSYDLFNNLIVAYMEGNYTNPDRRDREFERQEKIYPSAVRQLFLAHLAREQASGWTNESRLWALSNADRVLDWAVPDDGRLALNIISVLDWWSDRSRCPESVCTEALMAGLHEQRKALIIAAISGKGVAPAQRQAFAEAIYGLLVRSRLRRNEMEAPVTQLRGWLPPEHRTVADDLLRSERGRTELPRWVIEGQHTAAPWLTIRRNAGEWRAAALADFTGSVVRWAQKRSPEDREQTVVALRTLYGETPPPAVVATLVPRSRFRATLVEVRSSPWVWLLLAAGASVLLWLLVAWVVSQLREFQLLHTSFYDVERDYIDDLPAKEN